MPDILDSMIAIAIILFILSMIVEKITQLIRRYAPFPTSVNLWRNINLKSTGNSGLDKKIEREVVSLSFAIGVIIALLFHVDLFKMISADDPRKVLFWDSKVTYKGALDYVMFAVSILLTGFFLSFGSKFFHDLIDTLLQIKNLKRKLVDDNTYNSDTIQEFDDYLNRSYSSILQDAIDQNRAALTPPDSSSPPMPGRMRKGGRLIDCVTVHVKGQSRGTVPAIVQVKLSQDRVVSIPVDVITGVDMPSIAAMQGDSAANAVTASFQGTICCQLQKGGKDYLLTCSHVMTDGSSKNYFGDIKPAPAVISGQPDGSFTWATCNDSMDIALVEPVSTPFSYLVKPLAERQLTPSDVLETEVKVLCRGNVVRAGTVINDRCIDPVPLKYAAGETHGLSNLIILSKVTFSHDDISYAGITQPGDSGAMVLDAKDRPIGMIVAGGSRFSYAIPITDILHYLTATIN